MGLLVVTKTTHPTRKAEVRTEDLDPQVKIKPAIRKEITNEATKTWAVAPQDN